jgi:D-arabinose 5-phosphate isomerase GutQ
MNTKSNTIQKASDVIKREAWAVEQIIEQLDERINTVINLLFNCKGHVLVTGAGTSRAVAERFAHLLSCCGTPALFIHAADALHGGAGSIKPEDIVYIISKGGKSAEINQFAEIAHQRGARIIAHTEVADSPLAKLSDAVFQIIAYGDVDPYGMIATGSSLVNSAACDALCVCLLDKRGYTKEEFGHTHPGGAVGEKISKEKLS